VSRNGFPSRRRVFRGILLNVKAAHGDDGQGKIERLPKLLPEASLDFNFQAKQRRRMLAAAMLLLLALGVILLRDWDLWFGSRDADLADFETAQAATPESSAGHKSTVTQLPSERTRKRALPSAPVVPPADSLPFVTDRKALPPLNVQVVAGGESRLVQPNSSALKIEMQPASEPISSPMLAFAEPVTPPSTNASQRVNMSPATARALKTRVAPSYPVLARQMKVQGAVAIQALISSEGEIQDLHVLSGPNILASAAQEAVRQWRFKPYLQNGHPVETQARITVNFTISTF
jgi:TonB family protein